MSREQIQTLWAKRPIIISGPCSAETYEQTLQTILELAAIGQIDVIRAGIWKPRTRPGYFEGVGQIGLDWLIEARKQTGLPVMIEVATAVQVEQALHAGIDMVWIGARTTVNPFSVQEVASALKGTDIPVFIKNPIHADLELWQGAIERIEKAGISHIGLIHRGFSSYATTEFRNPPMWHLALEMKRRHPSLPFICDPSHICGRTDTLLGVAQKAIDLDYSGLIIESHICPSVALSDAKQQITPVQILGLLEQLVWRKSLKLTGLIHQELANFREQIDQLDDELLSLLGTRMAISDQIGRYKKQNHLLILQQDRWDAILQKSLKRAEALSLSQEFIYNYHNALHLESIAHQNNVMNDELKAI